MRAVAFAVAVVITILPVRAGLADETVETVETEVNAVASEPASTTDVSLESVEGAVVTEVTEAESEAPASSPAEVTDVNDASAHGEAEAAAAAPMLAPASTWAVTDPGDNGAVPNTLRWAFAQASADATPPVVDILAGLVIQLTCGGGGVLSYAGAQPLTINGNGATVEQTCAASAVIEGAEVINDLNVTGGTAGAIKGGSELRLNRSNVFGNSGGFIVDVNAGRAIISDSTIRDNEGTGVFGIHVELYRSTVSGNTAKGVFADQSATIVNSTITGNSSLTSGGGFDMINGNVLTLIYATIVENSAPQGANINMQFAGGGTLDSFASVIALAKGGGEDCASPGVITTISRGYNFTGDDSCGLDSGPGDQAAAGDPLLGPLQDNGGLTLTRLPLAGSPLIDAVDCAAAPIPVDVDQRGVARPQNGLCDIGAVEVEVPGIDGGSRGSDSGARAGAASLPFTGTSALTVIAFAALALIGLGFVARRFASR